MTSVTKNLALARLTLYLILLAFCSAAISTEKERKGITCTSQGIPSVLILVAANDRIYSAWSDRKMDSIDINFMVNDGPELQKWCPPQWIRCTNVPVGFSGKIVVTASKAGFISDTSTVTVPSTVNGCHPIMQPVYLSLRRDQSSGVDTVLTMQTPEQLERRQALIQPILQYAQLCTGKDFGDNYQAAMESMTEALGEQCLDRAAEAEPDRVINVVFSVRTGQSLQKIRQTLATWPIPTVTLIAGNLDRSADARSTDGVRHAKGTTTNETIANMRYGTNQVLNYLQECAAEPDPDTPPSGDRAQQAKYLRDVVRLCRDEAAAALSFVEKNGIPITGVEVRGPSRAIRAIRDRTEWITKTKVSHFRWY